MKKVSTKQRLLSVLLSVVLVMTSIQFNGITAKADDTNQNTTKVVTDWSKVEISDANVTSVSDVVTEIIFTESVTSVNLSSLDTTKLKGITFRNASTEINISDSISLASVKIWCIQGSTAEVWAKGRSLSTEYLNNDELSINYGGSAEFLTKYTKAADFDISAETGVNTDTPSVIEGTHYSNDLIWSTSDSDVLDFVVNGTEYSTVDSRWFLDNANTAGNIVNKDGNKSKITVKLRIKNAGTATITATSRSGKTVSIPYTVKKATENIEFVVKVYEPEVVVDSEGNELVKVDPVTDGVQDGQNPTKCKVNIKETEKYVFTNYADFEELKIDEGCYFTIKYKVDEGSEDYIRTSLQSTDNVIDGGLEKVDSNDKGITGMTVVGYMINGVEAPIMGDIYYANQFLTKTTDPFIIQGISKNNTTLRDLKVYVCKPCEKISVTMDESPVSDGSGYTRKRTDDLAMKADIGDSTDIVSWRILGNEGIASIGSPDSVSTNIHINTTGDFYIICEAKDFKTGVVNEKEKILIAAKECYEYDGLGFTDENREKIVKEYRIPVNYQVKTGEKARMVYIANVKDGNIYNKTQNVPNETLIYTSSDPGILNIEQNGVMTTGASTGSVTVTVQPKGRKDAAVSIPVVVYASLEKFNAENTSVDVPEGQYRDILINVTPDNSEEPIVWTVSDSNYAKAEEYFDTSDKKRYVRITGLKQSESEGKVIIAEGKGETSGVKSSINVNVQTPVHADVISISNEDKNADITTTTDTAGNNAILIRIAKGQKAVLIPNLTNNSGAKVNDMKMWGIEADTQVILGTVSGNNLELTGNAAGESYITLRAYGGAFEKEIKCKVQVYVPTTRFDISANGTTSDKINLEVGTTLTNVSAIFEPYDSTDEVTWSVKEEGIISLSKTSTLGNESIAISALKTGRAHLVATATSGVTDEIEVNVIKPADSINFTQKNKVVTGQVYINLNATETIGLEVLGDGTTDTEFTWGMPNDAGILVINPAEGGKSATIRGLASGTQVVTVSAPSGKTVSIEVVVVQPATSLELNTSAITVIKGEEPLNIYATLGPNTTTDQVTWSVESGEEGIISWVDAYDSSVTNTQKHIYVSAVKPGTAHLTATTVSGKTATVVVTSVVKSLASKYTKVQLSDMEYTGSSLKPYVTVYYKDMYLSEGTDYTIKFSQNKNPGRAAVKITGKGNFSGSKTVYFTIYPKAPKSAKMSSTSASSIKLTWSKSTGASGYIISVFSSKKNKYVKVATSTKNYVTLKKLTAGTVYNYSISPYVKVGSKTYVSSQYVTVSAGTSVGPVKIKKITSGSQDLTVKYSASKNADGYAIYTSTKKNGKYKLVTTTSDVTAYISGLKSKKTVYVKVRAYKYINGKTYYSSYSSAKSIKIK